MNPSNKANTMNSLILDTAPVAIEVQISDADLCVKLVDGRTLLIPLDWYPRLQYAKPAERGNWQLLGDGYAIEWPDLDEHIGVEGLLAGRRSGESATSLQKWLNERAK